MLSPVEEFINGTKDRFGQDAVSDLRDRYAPGWAYISLVDDSSTIKAVNAGLFDETALDPYELAAAKANIENNQDDQNSGGLL